MRRLAFTCLLAALVACFALVVSHVARPASAAPDRREPLPLFLFGLKISDLGVGEGTAFFKSVSGLSYETEVVDYQEGGSNVMLKRPGRTRFSNLVLKRTFTGQRPDDPIFAWLRDVASGKDIRKNITVLILKQVHGKDTEPVAKYDFHRCFPVKWEVSEMDSDQSDVVIERIEIAVETVSAG